MNGILWLVILGMVAFGVKEFFDYLRTVATNKRLSIIADTGEKTHTLVNSNMGAQLKLNAAVTRRLADLTKDTPDGKADAEAAEQAERLLIEHNRKQGMVDRKQESQDRAERGDRS